MNDTHMDFARNIKSSNKQRFYIKRPSFLIGANVYFAIKLAILIIAFGAMVVWFAYRHPLVQESNKTNVCLPVSEPLVISEAKATLYFPPSAFEGDPYLGEVKAKTFPNSLMFMGEPSFLTLPICASESYRFLWLRTFNRPVAVRVWQSDEGFYLVAKKLDKEGNLKDVRYRAITRSEWAAFKDYIEQASFWSLPTAGEIPDGNDGSYWILEGAQNGHYHVVERWSPLDRSYRAVCLYLLSLSGVDAEESYTN